MKRGYIQVYTGSGKGKTTAALGLALRAVGHGLRVCMVQFMKNDRNAGEVRAAVLLSPNLAIHPMGPKGFVRGTPRLVDFRMARRALDLARNVIKREDYDVVILDEVNVAVHLGIIAVEDLLALIDLKPKSVELVLTGRDTHPEVIEKADLVTEMVAVKHYFDKGVEARKGIER
jgi:cob(I)alamin adenosyltransferase